MSDSYLIDGYNLLHMLGMVQKRVGPGELDLARRRLLDFLVATFTNAPAVTVVFDAQHAPPGVKRQQEYQGLHIDFAPKKQTADDRIEDLIEQSDEPRRLVVISNDHRLQDAARRRGAQAWTHEDLLNFIDQKTSAKPKPGSEKERDNTPTLSPEEMQAWLKEFGAIEKDPELRELFEHDRFD